MLPGRTPFRVPCMRSWEGMEGNQFYWVNLKRKVLRKDVVDRSFIHFPRGVFLEYGKVGVSLRFFLQMSVNFIGGGL